MLKAWVRVAFVTSVVLASVRLTAAQDTRMVLVEGHGMRVQTVGLNHPTSPLVVFESGAGTGLATWSTVLADVGRFARAVAYDRAGIGLSEPDGHRPTPQHVAKKLHRLLAEMDLAPPYVLVGHSWGGPLIRMFAALFPGHVAGMVYVDPTDLRSREQHLKYLLASGFTAEVALQDIEDSRERMAAFVRSRTGPYRVEMEVIQANEISFSADWRALAPVSGVPVAVLTSGRFDPSMWTRRPCEPKACHEHWLRFRTEWVGALTAEAGPETVTIVAESGHEIQRDAPAVVVSTIRRILSAIDDRR